MVLLVGSKKVKTAVFISGTGSNLKSLIKFSKLKNSPISIELIVSSNNKAKGLIFAKSFKIKKKIFNFKKSTLVDKKLTSLLKKNNINLICLAGFMKILSNNFLKKFNGKIVNIHPSLLPKYKGLNTHKRALKNNENFSGCTVHYVASKGGVIAITRVLSREVGDWNITVNSIAPGLTASETEEHDIEQFAARIPDRSIKRIEVPEDLVGAGIFFISKESDFITGQTLIVDGGVVLN